MALLTKSEWKTKFSNFINRVSPFDVFPLIQKNEHEQLVGDDLGDSTIFREPTIQEITTPLTAFDVNFGLGDRLDVDTSANVDIDFTITLQNLQGNESGVINITKKAADTFVFSNAEVFTGADTFAQEGATSLVFLIRNIDGDVDGIDATNIEISRRLGSSFDNSNFNSTIINRGWVTITYEE